MQGLQAGPLALDAALRGAVLALLGVVAFAMASGLWHGVSSLRVRRAIACALALTVGLMAQTATSSQWVEYGWSCAAQSPWIGISTANAVLGWLAARALLEDDFRPRLWHGLLWVSVALLAGTVCLRLGSDAQLNRALQTGMQAVPLAMAVALLVAAIRNWRGDLVEPRRRLRLGIVLAGAAYIVMQFAARRAGGDGRFSPEAALVDALGLLGLAALLLTAVWHRGQRLGWIETWVGVDKTPDASLAASPRPEAKSQPVPSPADNDEPQAAPGMAASSEPVGATQSASSSMDERLLRELDEAMQLRHLYREEGLSIAKLASQLRVPEYRLRRAIHEGLGHRHFNAFVNGWRLKEARARLADPTQRHLPVLTMALEAGFQSIGPFNRAFKAETGLTPTAYRARALGLPPESNRAPSITPDGRRGGD